MCDLYAYIMSLKPVDNPVDDHELKFPYNLRRGVGVWRLAFLDGQRGVQGPVPEGVDVAQYRRGEYLVEGAGHCAECHSPRAFMGNVVGAALRWRTQSGRHGLFSQHHPGRDRHRLLVGGLDRQLSP